MLNFSRERQAIGTLYPILKLAPNSVIFVVFFGVVTALFEGLGLSLFIPLFQSLTNTSNPSENTILGNLWDILFSQFSATQVQVIAPLLILVLLALKNGFLYLNTLFFSRFNWRINHQLRTQIFNQLLRVESQFLMEQDAGTLISILDKEGWQTTQALSTLATLVISLCTLVIFSIFLLLTSWRLTLLSLLLLMLVSTGIQALTRQVKKLGQQAALANMNFVGQGFEQISGLETIHQFGRQSFEQRRFEQASQQVCSTFMELDQLMGVISPISELAFAILLTCILLIVLKVETTNISVFMTFLFMLYRLSPQIKKLDAARVNLVALTASVSIINDLIQATKINQLKNGSQRFDNLTQGIQFRDVCFQYKQSNTLTVKNLSFEVYAGKTTAIVGPSGGGKSTIIGLILRRFDPQNGVVEVDGQPLPEYDIHTWRNNLGLVSQNIYLFNTSVRENIAYGRPEASEEDLIIAAKMAAAHDFIVSLPEGYNTVIGEQGIRLSGGQRQRLALARCLVRNPKILILDEATNSLDSLSERFIQETLATFGRDHTVIIVAHRLSTIEQADQILVVDAGHVVEHGTLPQLLSLGGLFAQMYYQQPLGDTQQPPGKSEPLPESWG